MDSWVRHFEVSVEVQLRSTVGVFEQLSTSQYSNLYEGEAGCSVEQVASLTQLVGKELNIINRSVDGVFYSEASDCARASNVSVCSEQRWKRNTKLTAGASKCSASVFAVSTAQSTRSGTWQTMYKKRLARPWIPLCQPFCVHKMMAHVEPFMVCRFRSLTIDIPCLLIDNYFQGRFCRMQARSTAL